jgi:glycosyltransferase involved in cell wall biosynthesis
MIVKNESVVIKRCLESVSPWIDYWVIVDTGSTDGTQQIIKQYLKGIPGELHERPWVNFGYNRQEALSLAKGNGDYVLFIDADEILSGSIDKSKVKEDVYVIKVCTSKEPELSLQRAFLINNHLDWSWTGVLHESIHAPSTVTKYGFLPEIEIQAIAKDGFRSQDPNKYKKDAEVLEKALIDDPSNSTYVYYLAQSYFNAGEYALSLKNYQKRAEMGGWDQEIFWSKYLTANLQESLGMKPEEFIKSYCSAFEYRPTRIEPLYRISNYFLRNGGAVLAYAISKYALTISMPDDIAYMENWIYSYGLLLDHGNSCFELGKFKESEAAYREVLLKTEISKDLRLAILDRLANLPKKNS